MLLRLLLVANDAVAGDDVVVVVAVADDLERTRAFRSRPRSRRFYLSIRAWARGLLAFCLDGLLDELFRLVPEFALLKFTLTIFFAFPLQGPPSLLFPLNLDLQREQDVHRDGSIISERGTLGTDIIRNPEC